MGEAKSKAGCLICGADIVYVTTRRPLACDVCGEAKRADAHCLNGHFVCDSCHTEDPGEWIEQQCLRSDATRPLDLAIELMRHPRVAMHGPEHHFLVPAVLLTAYYNLKRQKDFKEQKVREARQRAQNVVGGSCGFHGACGSAIGVGIFVSLVTDATPLSGETWRLCNAATAQALTRIAEGGGPRCCKHNTFLALESGAEFSSAHLGQSLPTGPVSCDFYRLNRECRGAKCEYFRSGGKAQ
ncbi:MAG: SAM-dependent methyltransferase [Armatimonadia bacterium]|nr:SAM-dependent methyltransferase [Armatimonadia bacterium]